MKNVFYKSLFLASLSITFLAACASKQAAREHILLNAELDFWKEAAPAVFKARIQTTQGDFVIEAHRDWAPVGVDRFHNLVRAGFFDDSRFYRIRAGFIAQFGLPGFRKSPRSGKIAPCRTTRFNRATNAALLPTP